MGLKTLLADRFPLTERDIRAWWHPEQGFADDTPPRVLAAVARRRPGWDDQSRQMVVDAAAHPSLPDEVRHELVSWAGRFDFEAPPWVAMYAATLNPATPRSDAVQAAATGDSAALCGALERSDLDADDIDRLTQTNPSEWDLRVLTTFAEHHHATDTALRAVLNSARTAKLTNSQRCDLVRRVFAHPAAPRDLARQIVANVWHHHLAGDPNFPWQSRPEPNTALPGDQAVSCVVSAGALADDPDTEAVVVRLDHRSLINAVLSTTTSPAVLDVVVEVRDDPEVLIQVARHAATGPNALSALCSHRSRPVRLAAADHPACPPAAATLARITDLA